MLKRIEHPELFFGLVAPIGVDLADTAAHLEQSLKGVGYKVESIKVTEIFREIKWCGVKLEETPIEKRFRSYIRFGNQIRKLTKDKAICASLVIDKIAQGRERKNGKPQHREKRAYIIYQFKRREEIDLLRSTYGRLFFQVSVYSSRGERADAFAHRIGKDHHSFDWDKFKSEADALIREDEDQEGDAYGQRVREVFHLADFIINKDAIIPQRSQVDRFVDLIFGRNTLSPTKIEFGMYLAKVAALRSLDLSRQVGAAIFTQSHDVIALGCNEVPKGGGGAYWHDDDVDARDFLWEGDPNEEKKRSLFSDLFERLAGEKLIKKPYNINVILEKDRFKHSRLMDIIEFGRIVHAEMSALTDAARLGRSVKDATLFCTTFPCHICAKHITAAGVREVFFLEPYPKSAAFSLHPDSIEVEGASRDRFSDFKKVKFIHFHGVSPRRYRDFFEKGKRKKENGYVREWMYDEPKPILDLKLPVYLSLEDYVQKSLKKSIKLARDERRKLSRGKSRAKSIR